MPTIQERIDGARTELADATRLLETALIANPADADSDLAEVQSCLTKAAEHVRAAREDAPR